MQDTQCDIGRKRAGVSEWWRHERERHKAEARAGADARCAPELAFAL